MKITAKNKQIQVIQPLYHNIENIELPYYTSITENSSNKFDWNTLSE